MADEVQLSDYETTRARNIERNNARLRSLGLISKQEEEESNAAAWKKEKVDDKVKRQYEADKESVPSASRKRRKCSSRKSLRLKGLQPDGSVQEPEVKLRTEERLKRVQECREVRQRAALRTMELGAKRAVKENPTATYEHCLMRVRTMTDKALRNRVKAIERAAGKHCVVKMAIFKSCLQDEDMWDLAEIAGKALERLKCLQPPPDLQ